MILHGSQWTLLPLEINSTETWNMHEIGIFITAVRGPTRDSISFEWSPDDFGFLQDLLRPRRSRSVQQQGAQKQQHRGQEESKSCPKEKKKELLLSTSPRLIAAYLFPAPLCSTSLFYAVSILLISKGRGAPRKILPPPSSLSLNTPTPDEIQFYSADCFSL